MENSKKNTRYKALQSKIKVILMFSIIILMLSLASAEFTFDNVKSPYNLQEKSVTIKNMLGLGAEIGKATLVSNTEYCIINCEAEIKLELYQDYTNSLSEVKTYKLDKKTEISIEELKIQISDTTKDVEIPTFQNICKLIKANGTDIESCSQVQNGTTTIKEKIWRDYKNENLKAGTYYIKVLGKKGARDNIEWIPTIFGLKIEEWATWTSGLDAGLFAYYNFTDNTDQISGYTISTLFDAEYKTNASTKAGFGNAGFTGSGGKFTIADNNQLDFTANNYDFTINVWMKTDKNGNYYFLDKGATISAYLDAGTVHYDPVVNNIATSTINDPTNNGIPIDSWFMFTVRRNSTSTCYNINGTTTNERCRARATPGATTDVFSIGGGNGVDYTYVGWFDELGFWNRSLSESEINDLWNNGDGLVRTISNPSLLTVSLTYPSNNSASSLSSMTFNASYTYTNIDIKNGTYYIFFQNGSIFNKTTSTILSSLNTSSLIINNFTVGNYKWNVYGCGENTTDTICVWNYNNNYSLSFAGSLLNENYSQLTYETSSEKFMANFSLFPGSNVISSYLVYDETTYIVSDITNYGTSVELKRIIDIPLNNYDFQNETRNFYWSFIFSNGGLISQNTTNRQQEVKSLNIIYCNNTYQMNTLNFTTYDETNPNPKIKATFHTFWTFWKGSKTITKNYSFEDTTVGNSSFKFCISPNQSSMQTDLISEITSPNYFPRNYYLTNATVNNITQEVPIRLINTTLGVKFFHTIREGTIRVSDATVIISKFDVGIGTWVTVGIRKSDDNGEFIEYLELDKDYKYAITKNGEFLGILDRTSTCQATPCLMNLEISEESIELWKGINDIYAPNVVYNLSYDRNTHNVTYTFVDTTGLATYFRLQVNKLSANQTGNLLCNETLFSTLGTIACDLTGETGYFIANGYVSRSPEKRAGTLSGILSAIAETIGKDEGLFFAFMIIMVVGFVGIWNPAVGILLAGIAFIFSALMGLVMVSTTSMFLIGILVVILLIKLGKNGV